MKRITKKASYRQRRWPVYIRSHEAPVRQIWKRTSPNGRRARLFTSKPLYKRVWRRHPKVSTEELMAFSRRIVEYMSGHSYSTIFPPPLPDITAANDALEQAYHLADEKARLRRPWFHSLKSRVRIATRLKFRSKMRTYLFVHEKLCLWKQVPK